MLLYESLNKSFLQPLEERIHSNLVHYSPLCLLIICSPPGTMEDFPSGSEGKAYVCNAGDPDLISGLGISPGEGNGNPLQYSCLEKPMDGGA